MANHKIVGEMYGVLLTIKMEFDELGFKKGFDAYAKRRVLELHEKAFDWLLEDERESNEKAI